MHETDRNDEIEIDLGEVLGLMLHRLWLLLLCGILAGGAAFALSSFVLTPQYESTTKIYILSKTGGDSLTYSDTQLATQLTKDYGELITCRYVLESVIQECGLDDDYEELLDRVDVETITDTRIISITVKDPVPVEARMIADCIRDVASEHIQNVTDVEAVNVVDHANLPDEPSEPSVLIWTAVGGFLGVFLCAAILLVLYLTDDTIKSAEDAERYLGISTLALIPVMEEEHAGRKGRRKNKKGSQGGVRPPSEEEAEPDKEASDDDSEILIDDFNDR